MAPVLTLPEDMPLGERVALAELIDRHKAPGSVMRRLLTRVQAAEAAGERAEQRAVKAEAERDEAIHDLAQSEKHVAHLEACREQAERDCDKWSETAWHRRERMRQLAWNAEDDRETIATLRRAIGELEQKLAERQDNGAKALTTDLPF